MIAKKSITLFYFCLLCINIPSYSQITIDECHRLAEKNYPMINQYKLIDQAEQFTLSNASKGYLPQILLSGKATYQSEVTKIALPPALTQGFSIDPLSKDQYQLTVDVNQSVWDGGAIRSQQNIARQSSQVESKRTDVDIYTLKDRVNQLYFSILLFDEQLSLNTIMQNDLRIQEEKVRKYMDGGIATQADIDLVKVNLISLKQQFIEMQKNRDAYCQMLSAMIGSPISGGLIAPTIENKAIPTETLRPELELFDSQIRLSEGQRKVVQAKNMPRFNLFVQGGYGRPGLNMLKNEFQPFYIGGIRLSWNFGNLYTRKGELRLIDNQQNQIEIQRNLFMYNITQQQIKVRTEIEKYSELMADDDEAIRLRENIRKSAEAKTESGILSVADMMRDINAQQIAMQNKVLHKVQMLMSIYSLKYITNNQ